MSATARPTPRGASLVLVLGMLVALGPFTIDVYLPAFPSMRTDLGTTASAIQLTLTGATLGFGVGQLLVGPLSDSVGRRMPLLVSTAIHVIASIGAALSPDVVTLGVFRVLQGMGVTATGVVVVAIVRDLFTGRRLVRAIADLAVVSGVAPIVAPVIGSLLLAVTDWRGIFLVIGGYGLLALVAASAFVPESLPSARRARLTPGHVLSQYRVLAADPAFPVIALVGAATWAVMFSYLAASPFLFQDLFGLDTRAYGLLFTAVAVFTVLGGQVASRLLTPRMGLNATAVVTTSILLLAGLVLLAVHAAGLGLPGLITGVVLLVLGGGATFPCLQLLGLRDHGERAATATSLLGAVNFGAAGLATPVVGALGVGSILPLAGVVTVGAVVATGGAAVLLVRERARTNRF